jgi:hypothetical protein
VTTRLDPQSLERLVKLLGMMGSAHAGERSVAAQKADQLVRERGLTWGEVFSYIAPAKTKHNTDSDNTSDDWQRMRKFCLQYPTRLRPREHQFLLSLASWRGDLTEKQEAWLMGIYLRVSQRC